jgi:hypothetical protein
LNQEGFCHFDKSAQKTQAVTLNGKVYKAEAAATITGWRTTAVFRNGTETDGRISTLKSLIVPISQANLKNALHTRGPVSVSIDATPPDFYYYGGGIFDNTACTSYDLDHSVLAVGYGRDTKTGKDYWFVQIECRAVCTVLCSVVSCRAALRCAALCCAVLCCAVLCCAMPLVCTALPLRVHSMSCTVVTLAVNSHSIRRFASHLAWHRIVKNSWSSYWGEEGYVRVAIDEHNICGVATTPNYVVGLTVGAQQ